MKLKIEYHYVIRTNGYAGNYERELTAFVTGLTGDSMVGEDYAKSAIKRSSETYIDELQEKINSQCDDEHGMNFCSLYGSKADDLLIIFNQRPSKKDLGFLEAGLRLFASVYEQKEKEFVPKGSVKILGWELMEARTGYKLLESQKL
jgi:hypothetical protein